MELVFRQVKTDEQSIVAYVALLKIVFAKEDAFSKEYITWLYKNNPFGEAVGFDAYDGDILAAHYVTTPVCYTYKGKKIKGLLSLNTATHPDYQGKGMFTKLADQTYKYAAENGFEFVIGVANQNSTHGFLKKLGFKLISPLDVYLIMGNAIRPLVNPADFFTSCVDDNYIKWRMANPQGKYFTDLGLHFSLTHNATIDVCMGTKYKAEQKSRRSPKIRMSMGVNNTPKALLKFKLPDRLKPSPLNLILKPLSADFPDLQKKDIFFEVIDFDAY
jgi:GNAT superfamily N-acetyltransferase